MTVPEYIKEQAAPFRPKLKELREIIFSVAPDATESVSYKVPCFKYIYWLVGIGVTKKDCSMYLMSHAIADQLKVEGFNVKGVTLHFPLDEPLPVDLIRRIVRERMKENENKAKLKT
jgi:uncharacterized protein YdhG (YjbR/CyaY superfamily)